LRRFVFESPGRDPQNARGYFDATHYSHVDKAVVWNQRQRLITVPYVDPLGATTPLPEPFRDPTSAVLLSAVGQLIDLGQEHRVYGGSFDRRSRHSLLAGIFDEFSGVGNINPARNIDAAVVEESFDPFVAIGANTLVAIGGGNTPSLAASAEQSNDDGRNRDHGRDLSHRLDPSDHWLSAATYPTKSLSTKSLRPKESERPRSADGFADGPRPERRKRGIWQALA
jgi:hypothetical protein